MSENWKKLEGLAKAGYYFRSNDIPRSLVTDNILITDAFQEVAPLILKHPKGMYILGPERDKQLLFSKYYYPKIETIDISQSRIPGVVQILTGEDLVYIIHQTHDTLPVELHYSHIALEEYCRRKLIIDNQFRHK